MSVQSACGCPLNTVGGVDHRAWCTFRLTAQIHHPGTTWLQCPTCGSGVVRTLAMGWAECPVGHKYALPDGPISFTLTQEEAHEPRSTGTSPQPVRSKIRTPYRPLRKGCSVLVSYGGQVLGRGVEPPYAVVETAVLPSDDPSTERRTAPVTAGAVLTFKGGRARDTRKHAHDRGRANHDHVRWRRLNRYERVGARSGRQSRRPPESRARHQVSSFFRADPWHTTASGIQDSES